MSLGATTVAQGSLVFNCRMVRYIRFDPGTDFDDLATGVTTTRCDLYLHG